MAVSRCESIGILVLRLIQREQELLGREHRVSIKERLKSLVSGLGNWVDGGDIHCARQWEEEELVER